LLQQDQLPQGSWYLNNIKGCFCAKGAFDHPISNIAFEMLVHTSQSFKWQVHIRG